MKKQNKKGFSLLELILVLGVGSMMAFMRFQDMKTEQENVMAKAVGQQMKQIGEAVNGYINIRYDKLSTLTSSSSQSSDPGPRTCNGSGCEITYQTLINEGLLPVSYTGVNAQKSSYKIMLKRSGATPNYVVNGLITTTLPWSESGKLRYDLLGKAMQEAGIDSGMTRTTSNAFGYGGQWSETSANFNNITSAGQLAFRVGFNSALYSIYLRRDGTLPMTGNLNMGGQSIYNAQDITAAGTTTTGILKTNAAATVGTTLNVAGVTTLGSDLNVSGNGQINGNLNSNNTVSGTTVTSRGETYTQNWFRTLGDGGIYFQKYGGGWNMGDTATINAYGGKNVQTTAGFYGGYVHSTGNIDAAGTVNAAYVWASGNLNSNYVHSNGNIDANGRINAGEFVYINGQANVGWGCSPNGLQGRTPEGAILSCVNGVWKSSSARIERTQFLVSSGSNYGDICQSNINSNGMAAQGWVASGSDACTEDGNNCSVDNVRCFAIRIVN
ncbi:shufflon system plasmid conjugative transfer pilus tip adhesin PilV [Citrobacter freundii]|uniref:shufflon system plasmid conjugative transfer pilus tip adhesin PilV n=1 Tax=Citrobacter freundii TaxID=546 RepID=UPI002447D321|nr:shufflon system plasmid conjugative transfer pilus tip adhesin PilV [Citrobacter freundii]MDH0386679.1 shufflon system plasmid conjugative transfer pilus tip adhesin PilV [Citrobacter freundii]